MIISSNWRALTARDAVSRSYTRRFAYRRAPAAGVETPTVADLAAVVSADPVTRPHVEHAHRHDLEDPDNALRPWQRQEGPASFSQQRLWFLEHLFPGSPVSHVPLAMRLSSSLHAAVLGRCFDEIMRRHAVLRTTFAYVDGQLMQQISSALPVLLEVRDLCQLPSEQRETTAQRLITEVARQPFDLAQGPLLRAVLFQLSDTEQLLLLVIHHIAADGWSLGLLVQELTQLYPAFAAEQPSPLRALPIQYLDFAIWQRSWLQGERLQQLLTYWKQQLTGVPSLLLPTGSTSATHFLLPWWAAPARPPQVFIDCACSAWPTRGQHAIHDIAGGVCDASGSL